MPESNEMSASGVVDNNSNTSNSDSLPTPAVSLVPQHAFRKEMCVSQPTVWRWANKGWLSPVNISGRTYFTLESVKSFMKRARAGEFAKSLPIPSKQEAA